MARALVARNYTAVRHTWLVFVSGFFEPVFYLVALGLGVGALVGTIDAGGGLVVPYAVFVAPALLASSAMNGAVYDSTTNVFFKLVYSRLYDAVLATPLGPRDIAVGEVTWALLRGVVYSVAFLAVSLVAGVVGSPWAVLAVPAATLIGWAFAALGMAATTYMRTWQDFDYIQLAVLPMFLFSATFYPIDAYPPALRWLVTLTPLYQGVSLVRELMLGQVGWGLAGHALYLVVLGLAGTAWAARRVGTLLLR
jgi:lipooligosaccharide transport system permease protein